VLAQAFPGQKHALSRAFWSNYDKNYGLRAPSGKGKDGESRQPNEFLVWYLEAVLNAEVRDPRSLLYLLDIQTKY
jgi:hypothetical protein